MVKGWGGTMEGSRWIVCKLNIEKAYVGIEAFCFFGKMGVG